MKDRQDFFSALNLFFDHVYVITLERATDRHEHIRKELMGLTYEFFFGKDKNHFTVEQLMKEGVYNESLAKQHHRYGKPMFAGQIGCAWSHAEVYRDAIKKAYKAVLILEDDVVIDANAPATFAAVQNELPETWQLLYLGFAEREKPPAGAFLKKAFYHVLRFLGKMPYTHATINRLYPKKLSAHVSHAGYHDCTHAYGLTLEGARQLLALQEPLSFVADNLLAYAATNSRVEAYIAWPRMINQQYQVGNSTASYLNA